MHDRRLTLRFPMPVGMVRGWTCYPLVVGPIPISTQRENLMNLLTAFLELRKAIATRDPRQIWTAAKALLDIVIGVEGFAAGEPDDETKAAYAACVTDFEAVFSCDDGVRAIGDGAILKALFKLLVNLAPLFM